MKESVRSFGGWGVSLKLPVLESVSSFGGWGVSLTSPELETVWFFLGWGMWGVSLTRPALETVSLSSVGETLFQALYRNLSYRYVGDNLLNAPC